MSLSSWRFQVDVTGSGELSEFFMDATLSPLRDEAGAVAGVSLLIVDVTERERARQAASEDAEQAREQFRAARDVVAQVQQALLTTTLPVLPGAEIARRPAVTGSTRSHCRADRWRWSWVTSSATA